MPSFRKTVLLRAQLELDFDLQVPKAKAHLLTSQSISPPPSTTSQPNHPG